jgi:hypothetical protein
MTEQISNNKKIVIVKVTKPDYLSGLTGAIYILKCLSDGLSKDQIISDIFEGDRQLVFIWIEFLKNHHWLEENENSNTGDHGRVKITLVLRCEGNLADGSCSNKSSQISRIILSFLDLLRRVRLV